MSETKNDEHGPDKREPLPIVVDGAYLSADPIDYSRPVGWWCAFCEEDQPCTRAKLSIPMACKHIPRYLPLPTPEPVEVDEVETGEAEIATSTDGVSVTWFGIGSKGRMVYRACCSPNFTLDTEHIERVTASANARKKRGQK